MYCNVCGRKLPAGAEICKSCGTPVKRKKVVREGIRSTLGGYARIGERQIKVWALCVLLAGAVTLLAVSSAYIPKLYNRITEKADELIPENQVTVHVTEIPKVSGTIIIIPDEQLPSKIITSERAFSDDSWERDLLVDNKIKIRLLRRPTVGDEWVNKHIFALYPDVLEAESFPECDTVSGYSANRIQISSTESAPGCVVEAVRTTDGTYDHIYVLEIPTDLFEEYEEQTNIWAETAILVDADTLEEQPKPESSENHG